MGQRRIVSVESLTMTRLISPALLACLSLALLPGCSTHEEKFGDAEPVRVPSAIELTAATDRLLTVGEEAISSLNPATLATFTEAASEFATASGAPAARARADRFADVLLLARVPGRDAFYGADDPSKVDLPTTVRAGAALRAAFEATANPRFGKAASAIPGQILTPTSGWRSEDGVAYLFNSPRSKRASIAETSLAAGELAASDRELNTGTDADALEGLKGVSEAQVALGRWYSTLGTKQPMTLLPWANTLLGLEAQQAKAADGILAAGIPAMYDSAFTQGGRVIASPLTEDDSQSIGVAVSALGRSSFATLAAAAQRNLLDHARTDGTIDLAPADDVAAQAQYARALAIGLGATVRAERAKAAGS